MNAVDRLALRWQFESFTKEYQDECCDEMIKEFVDAWRFKRNRAYIKMRIDQLHECRSDLFITQKFLTDLFDKDPTNTMIDIDFFAKDWSKYDIRKTKKAPYIGPEAYLQM